MASPVSSAIPGARAPQLQPQPQPQPQRHPLFATFDHLLVLREALKQAPGMLGVRFTAFCAEHVRQSQAEIFQDLFVLFLLGGKRDGYFVEFGACDGVTLSNTCLLEREFGWNGILAEPARGWREGLHKNRIAAIDTRCVWHRSGDKIEFAETEWKELSTAVDLVACDGNRDHRKITSHYLVSTISLNDLLTTHAAPKTIDYMSVDTEGSELAILQAFDFEAHDVQIVTVEHNFRPERAAIFELMRDRGYVLPFPQITRQDDWFVKQPLLDKAMAS